MQLQDVVRPAYFVPESMLARQILREFQKRHVQLAIVVDEHGGMAGIVTVEDIIEELVGELFSEDDPPEKMIQRDGRSATVHGQLPVREANRVLDLQLPESEDWNTIAGLCMHLAGGVPRQGTRLPIPGIATLEILDASARHVRLVRIQPVRRRGMVARGGKTSSTSDNQPFPIRTPHVSRLRCVRAGLTWSEAI